MTTIWKIAPGRHAEEWPNCLAHRCIAIGWEIGDYRRFRDKAEILRALRKTYEQEKGAGAGAARSIWRFVHEIRKNDVVVANEGARTIVGIGKIVGEYIPAESPRNPIPSTVDGPWWRRQARRVDWIVQDRIQLRKRNFFVASTVQRLTTEQCDEIRMAYNMKYPALSPRLDELLSGPATCAEKHRRTTKRQLAAVAKELSAEGVFDPSDENDDRVRALSSIVVRRGQPRFRRHLLRAYGRRCAITGCDVEPVLEAAHISPYKGAKTDHPSNGLLLRADLHTLFDLGLVAVDIDTMRILISDLLKETTYQRLSGTRLRLPKQLANHPNRIALEKHCNNCGLAQ